MDQLGLWILNDNAFRRSRRLSNKYPMPQCQASKSFHPVVYSRHDPPKKKSLYPTSSVLALLLELTINPYKNFQFRPFASNFIFFQLWRIPVCLCTTFQLSTLHLILSYWEQTCTEDGWEDLCSRIGVIPLVYAKECFSDENSRSIFTLV